MRSSGVSVLVGFILLMMIVMLMIAFMQTQLIPNLCKGAEFAHENKILDEVEQLNDYIMDNRLTAVTFDLAVNYPKIPLLISPPQMTSSITAVPFNITLSYYEVLPNGTLEFRSLKYTTDRILVDVNNFYTRNVRILLENTAVLKILSGRYMEVEGQEMFEKGEVRIPLINATFRSFSTSEPVDILVVPVSYGGYVMAKNLTITFTTLEPGYWRDVGERIKGLGYELNVTGDVVRVKCLNTTKLVISYTVLVNGISITGYSAKTSPARIIALNPTNSYSVGVGDVLVLGVKVLDRYNNPVRGIPVNVTLSNPTVGNLSQSLIYTDGRGVALDVFRANSEGFTYVNFTAPCGNVSYSVYVRSTGQTLSYPYAIVYDAETSSLKVYGNDVYYNPPSSPNVPSIEFSNLSALEKDDGIYLTSYASLYNHSAQRFVFTGLRVENVTSTYVLWNGYGVGSWSMMQGGDGESLYLWNFTSGSYDLMSYTATPSEVWLCASLNSTTLKNYVRNGEMIVLVVQNGITKNYYSELATDYICVCQVLG